MPIATLIASEMLASAHLTSAQDLLRDNLLTIRKIDWIDESQDVAILIGGPEGIDPNYLAQTQRKWSLSAMTFAHPVVRIMLAEQLYRAWSINANLPYHRGD